jgi:hypothetical protein
MLSIIGLDAKLIPHAISGKGKNLNAYKVETARSGKLAT